MSAIISLSEGADYLNFLIREFQKKHPKYDTSLGIKESKDEAARHNRLLDFYHAILDNEFEQRLIWATRRQDSLPDKITEMFPWWSETGDSKAEADLWMEVFDPTILEINVKLDSFMESRTWLTYTTLRVGGSMIINAGQDFRILDWERIQAEKKGKRSK